MATDNKQINKMLIALTSKFVEMIGAMETATIRQKLHEFIDSIEDKKAEAIYTMFENEIDSDAFRKQLVQEERARYLAGEGKSYSWKEVKEMATNKEKRDAV